MHNPSKSRLSPPSTDSIAINVFRSFGYAEEHGLGNVLRHTEMSRQESAGSRRAGQGQQAQGSKLASGCDENAKPDQPAWKQALKIQTVRRWPRARGVDYRQRIYVPLQQGCTDSRRAMLEQHSGDNAGDH